MDSPDLPAWLYTPLVFVVIIVLCCAFISLARQGDKAQPRNRMSYSEWGAWLARQQPDRPAAPTASTAETTSPGDILEQETDSEPTKPSPS